MRGGILPLSHRGDLYQPAISPPRNGGNGQRVWRRRKLVRKIKETGKLLTMDIEWLLLSEGNHFDFINEVAAEVNEYVENNRDEYGGTQKAILHVMSNRVNDMGLSDQKHTRKPTLTTPGLAT